MPHKWNDDILWALYCAIWDAEDEGQGRHAITQEGLRNALVYHGLQVTWHPDAILADQIEAEQQARIADDEARDAEESQIDQHAFERQHAWGKL